MSSQDSPQPILYIDDQSSHRALFEKAFNGKYAVWTASSGAEGLELLKKKEFFLVLADHRMPGMTGIDFLEKAQSLSPWSVRALLSAYLNEAMIKEATERIFIHEHLRKPWKLEHMTGFVEKALQEYEASHPIGNSSEIISPEAILPPTPSITPDSLFRLKGILEATVDAQEARRVFLQFVEPKLKDFVALIRRPCATELREAQAHALRGDYETLENILRNYFSTEDCQEFLSSLLESQKIIH